MLTKLVLSHGKGGLKLLEVIKRLLGTSGSRTKFVTPFKVLIVVS